MSSTMKLCVVMLVTILILSFGNLYHIKNVEKTVRNIKYVRCVEKLQPSMGATAFIVCNQEGLK